VFDLCKADAEVFASRSVWLECRNETKKVLS